MKRMLVCCLWLATGAFAQEPIAEPAAAAARFDVFEYRVLGNSVLPVPEVERAVYPHLGPARDFSDVEGARQSLEGAYRRAGYATVFVDVPEQGVDDGIVRLQVTEGRVDRVRISGARYFRNGRIREGVPSLVRGAVPKLGELQGEVNALNTRSADRAVVPVLKAGRTPGTVDVTFNVQDELPLHGSFETNNRYTADTSELRATVALSYDNLFQREHSLALQYQFSPEERTDVEAMVASYAFRPTAWPNTLLAFYAVDSNTDVAALGTLSVLGQGRIFGARAIRSLAATDSSSSGLTFGVDYKDFLERIQFITVEGQQVKDDFLTPISYLNWSLGFNSQRRYERGTAGFNVEANFGLRRTLNQSLEFENKRYKSHPNYFYLRARGELQRAVRRDWHLVARLSGQFSPEPLVSNEQFAVGGADTVRGYLESSALGDYGVNFTAELRHGALARGLGLAPGQAYFMAFYDAGLVAINEPLPSQARRFDLASYGVGLRIEDWHGLSLAVDWARVLTPTNHVAAGDDRAHFQLRYGF